MYPPGRDASLPEVGDTGLSVLVDAAGHGQAQGGALLLHQLHDAGALKLVYGTERGRVRAEAGQAGRERPAAAEAARSCHPAPSVLRRV